MRRLFANLIIIPLALMLLACSDKQDKDAVWIQGWQETASLPIPRAGAAAVVSNGVIYMIGGVDGRNILNDAIYARINNDGSLAPWQQGTALQEERVFIDAVVRDGSIYVIGGGKGANGEDLLNTVERARILPDGSLGPWEAEAKMVLPRRCSKVTIIGDSIYSFGGFGGALLDTVERVSFLEDGKLGEWQLEKEKLTIPRYVTGLKKYKDIAYVIGGHDQTKGVGIQDVEWSRVSSSGAFQKWQSTSSLQTGRYGLATAGHNDDLFALGGITGAEYLDSIEKSRVSNDGGVSQWVQSTPLTQPRASFNAVVYKDWIYVLGGTNREGYLTSVEYATFDKAGNIGFTGNQAQAQAYKVKIEERKKRKLVLPNAGIVKEVIHASAYSYMLVQNDKQGLVWIAGPKTELKPETRIQYSTGVFMSNFYSKELQRNFPSVLFVGTIQIED